VCNMFDNVPVGTIYPTHVMMVARQHNWTLKSSALDSFVESTSNFDSSLRIGIKDSRLRLYDGVNMWLFRLGKGQHRTCEPTTNLCPSAFVIHK